MAVDTAHGNVRPAVGLLIRREGALERDAELTLLQSGGDIRMRVRIDVGVHAQRYRRALVRTAGDGVQGLELGLRLDVEAQDAGLEGARHLGLGLTDAR